MKNNILQFVSCFAILTLASACSQDLLDQPASPDNLLSKNSHKVTLEEALERSKVFRNGLNEGLETRSMQISDIESVNYLSSGIKTRGQDTDTIFYLVNYKNEQGFMLLSADERTIPVYAMADEGKLDLNDTTFNEGLRAFYNLAKNDALSARIPTDTITFGGGIDIDPFDYTYDRTVKPMFSKNLRSIGQGEPFNTYCKHADGTPALVGCLPVAVGSVLAYYHRPVIYKGRFMPWSNIDVDIKNDMFYMLLDSICDEDLLNAERKPGSTSAKMNRVASTLKHFGVRYSELQDFNDFRAAEALENAPIIIYGKSPESAHAWVIDGYIRYGILHNSLVGPEPGRQPPYFFFHCCWGWSGKSNGYFYYRSTDRIDGTANSFDNDDSGYCEHQTYYNMKMNIKL